MAFAGPHSCYRYFFLVTAGVENNLAMPIDPAAKVPATPHCTNTIVNAQALTPGGTTLVVTTASDNQQRPPGRPEERLATRVMFFLRLYFRRPPQGSRS